MGNGGFDSSGSSDLQLHDPSVPPSKDSLLSIEDKSLRGGGGVGSSSSQVFFSVLETSETNSSTYTTSGQQQQTGGGIPVSTTPTSIKADISMAKLEVGGSSGGSSNLLERKKSTSKRTSFQFVKSKIETSSPSLLDTSENNSASSDCESVDLMNTVATPAPQTPPLQAATLVASNSVTAFPNSSASSGSSAVSSTYASNSSSSNHVHNNSIVVSNLASKKKDSKEKSVMNNVSDLFKRKRSLTSPNHPGFNDARLAKSTIQANEKIGPDALPHPGFAPNDSFSSSLSNSFKLPQDDIYKEDDTPKAIITGLNNSGGGGERSKTSTTTTLSSTTTATAEVSIIPASSLPLFSSSPLSSLSSRDSTPLLQPSAIPSPNDNAGSKSLEDLTVVKLDVPASCDCGTHTGTVLLDEIFDIELSELWSAMFGRPDCLFKMVLAKREAESKKFVKKKGVITDMC